MADRPTGREIERTQPGPLPTPTDPGEGLRHHMSVTPRRSALAGALGDPSAPPHSAIPQARPHYLFHVYNEHGGFIRTYLPHEMIDAEKRAAGLNGFVTADQIVRDYRENPDGG